MAASAIALLLVGCEAQFTSDLATDPPADTDITGVQVNLRGLEFRKDNGATPTLEFRAGELVDLLALRDGNVMRVFTDERLPAGNYTGVRLLFDKDEDPNGVATVNDEFPLNLAAGDFAAVDFSVEDRKNSREAITLMLDLRQSLSFDEADSEYTLKPTLRAVTTDDAAQIEGAVTVSCPSGTSLASGGAVYAFPGKDVEPDDLDGVTPEPIATTQVVASGQATFRYALRFLPAGKYTLAVTCRGHEDVLDGSDALDFRGTRNVEVSKGQVLQRDLS